MAARPRRRRARFTAQELANKRTQVRRILFLQPVHPLAPHSPLTLRSCVCIATLAALDPSSDDHSRVEEDLADTLFELSTVTELRQPSEAVPLLRRCLQIQMARHGEQSEDALMCNELLAKALSEADQKGEEVVQTLRRGLEMKRNVHGEDSQEVADAHNELAVALQEMGESQLAEQEARNALSLHIELFGESHMYTGTCICNLATLLQQQNKLHPAEMLLRHCLRIYEAELGATHEDTVEVIASLVDVLWYLKRVDEACSLLTRQLDLQSKQPDIDPVVLAQGHAALGALHWGAKDADAALSAFEKAEDNYQQAIDSLDSTLPETAEEEEELAERRLDLGTELASCLNSMGIVLQEQGHPEKALARLLRAVQLYEVTMGPQHAFVGIGHHNLGLIRFELGQLEPARRSLEIAVEVCRHSLGTLHRDFPRRARVVEARALRDWPAIGSVRAVDAGGSAGA